MASQAPVISSVYPEDVQLFLDYIGVLHDDNVAAARTEAHRLAPYFNALSLQLKDDAKATHDHAETASPNDLSRLFQAVATYSGNTILSEIVLGPEALLKRKDTRENSKPFGQPVEYDGHSFTFGFMQVFNKWGTGSVSVPMLCFDNELMSNLHDHQPERMLRAMQAIATAGNHDMLHQYTNDVLKDGVAKGMRDPHLADPILSLKDWFLQNFDHEKDSDPNSYESWLMFSHARVRHRMDDGPEGKELAKNCDIFFDELARIGQGIKEKWGEEKANTTVDYFGTMLLYTMMRYMPINHPLMTYAIERLQAADPDPLAVVEARQESILAEARSDKPYMAETLANYKAAGVDLLPEHPDYADLKRVQVISITPWVAHRMSQAQPGTLLAAMKDDGRVAKANVDMVKSATWDIWFDMSDGVHVIDLPDNKTGEVHFKDRMLHCEDGPALTVRGANGSIEREEWYQSGIRSHDTGYKSTPRHSTPNR